MDTHNGFILKLNLISRKIHREGYRGNFYADKTAPLYQDAIDKAIYEDIQNYFNNEINN